MTKAASVRSALEEEELQSTVKMCEREIPCQTKKKKLFDEMHFIITPLWDLSKNVSQKIAWKRLATKYQQFSGTDFHEYF